MKIRNLALLALASCLLSSISADKYDIDYSQQKENDPLLVILLMVRDEEAVIEKTLETYIPTSVKYGSDTGELAYIVYDTGSVDKTCEIAEDVFKKYGLKHTLIAKDTWVDFATSRNRALDIARSTYPQSTFILFPDAEWYLETIDSLLDFCRCEKLAFDVGTKTPPPYYRNRMVWPGLSISLTGRLFSTADDVCFEKGVDIHECPNKCSGASTPSSIHFIIGQSQTGKKKSAARWHRDKEKQLKRLERDPKDIRALHYLAKTERWLSGEVWAEGVEKEATNPTEAQKLFQAATDYNKDSYKHWQERVKLHSFPEEDYEAMYELAVVTDILSNDDPEHYTWQEALSYYLKAFCMRPRAEPLARVAAHYMNNDQFQLSYIFAKRATELPIPEAETEILPVNMYVYEFERWEILSRVAWYVNEFEVGEHAAQKAIEARPNSPHLYRNLSFYWERKQAKA